MFSDGEVLLECVRAGDLDEAVRRLSSVYGVKVVERAFEFTGEWLDANGHGNQFALVYAWKFLGACQEVFG